MRGVAIIHGIVGLMGMQFTLCALIDCVMGAFVSLGASNMSLQFIMVGLQLFEFLFMAAFHLCDAGLELAESIIVRRGRRAGIRIF